MLTLWSVVAAVVLVVSVVLVLMARRIPSEIYTTIRAFDDLRAALRPAVAGLRVETEALGERRATPHGPGNASSRR